VVLPRIEDGSGVTDGASAATVPVGSAAATTVTVANAGLGDGPAISVDGAHAANNIAIAIGMILFNGTRQL
jgi:hypothetical protein